MIKIIAVLISIMMMTSCTLSFTNVSTHGSASDVVDSDPSNDVKSNPTLNLPAI